MPRRRLRAHVHRNVLQPLSGRGGCSSLPLPRGGRPERRGAQEPHGPEPVPVDVKVIMIGRSQLYHMLHSYDEDFRKIFKVRADFDYEVKETPANIKKYLQFISRVVREESLRHFDRGATQAVIEQAFKLVDHQNKLSIRFSEIVRLIRESSYWAKQRRHKFVHKQDVNQALEEEKYRRNLPEEKIQNAIRENTYIFDVGSYKVGQINGLAVYNLGDYKAAQPDLSGWAAILRANLWFLLSNISQFNHFHSISTV